MATILTDTTVTLADGSTVQTITYTDGGKSVTYVPGPGTPAANQQTIQQRAVSAMDANNTYLALAAPSNAQVAAQVKLLTRETTGLIKLALGLLSDTTGT